jgi:hypothetical protein
VFFCPFPPGLIIKCWTFFFFCYYLWPGGVHIVTWHLISTHVYILYIEILTNLSTYLLTYLLNTFLWPTFYESYMLLLYRILTCYVLLRVIMSLQVESLKCENLYEVCHISTPIPQKKEIIKKETKKRHWLHVMIVIKVFFVLYYIHYSFTSRHVLNFEFVNTAVLKI